MTTIPSTSAQQAQVKRMQPSQHSQQRRMPSRGDLGILPTNCRQSYESLYRLRLQLGSQFAQRHRAQTKRHNADGPCDYTGIRKLSPYSPPSIRPGDSLLHSPMMPANCFVQHHSSLSTPRRLLPTPYYIRTNSTPSWKRHRDGKAQLQPITLHNSAHHMPRRALHKAAALFPSPTQLRSCTMANQC